MLDLEYNPKSLAVSLTQEATTAVEDLKQAIKSREAEIRQLEESLQSLDGSARRPHSISPMPISPAMDMGDPEQRVTIPVPRTLAKANKGPVSVARPPIFKMKGDDLPEDARAQDPALV